MTTISVRFLETQYYDVQEDAEVVRFTATTPIGSFWTEVFAEGPCGLRRDRQEFKNSVVEMIQNGQTPCFVKLEGELH